MIIQENSKNLIIIILDYMKKLNKLEINSKNLLKNEELIALKGGCSCMCYNWEGGLAGVISGSNALYCNPECLSYFGHGYGVWTC
jgi:hypothetical protein